MEGRTIEIVSARYKLAKAELEKSKILRNKMTQNISDFQEDLEARRKHWLRVRKCNSALVNAKFSKYLTHKGCRGDLFFDHGARTLKVRNQVSDSQDDASQCSDVRQLSGGERSFTSLCLLLALGHAVIKII